MFSIYRRPVALSPVVHHRQAPVYQLLPQASYNSPDTASARSQRKPGIPAGYYRVYGGNSASSSSANLPVGSTARAGVTRPALTNWDSLRLRYLRKGPNNSSNDFAKQKNGVAAVSPTNHASKLRTLFTRGFFSIRRESLPPVRLALEPSS